VPGPVFSLKASDASKSRIKIAILGTGKIFGEGDILLK
jgi:hypothetical protein